MEPIGYLEAWLKWSSGEKLESYVLWGISILWWARFGKIIQFLGGFVVVLDLIGPQRLRDMATLTRRTGNGIGGEAKAWWRASIPIRWEDPAKAKLFLAATSISAVLFFWRYLAKEIPLENVSLARIVAFFIFGMAVSIAWILYFCAVTYLVLFLVRSMLRNIFLLFKLTNLVNEEERAKGEKVRVWWIRFTPLRWSMDFRGGVILLSSLALAPFFVRFWPGSIIPDFPGGFGLSSVDLYSRWSAVLAASFVLAWGIVLAGITLILVVFHAIQGGVFTLAYLFERDHPRHPIRWGAFLFFSIGFHFDLLGS